MPGRKLTPQDIEDRKIISSNLNSLLAKSGRKKSDITSQCKIPASTLTGYFAGTRLPTAENVKALAEFFHVKPEEIDPRLNPAPSNVIPINRTELHRIPVIGTISCGDPIDAEENIVDYINVPEPIPTDAFALVCEGSSMEPSIVDGDKVVIEPTPDVEDGQVAAVLVDDQTKATLKRIKHIGNSIWLMPDNRDYDPIVLDAQHPGRIIGKAIKLIRDRI